MKSEERILFDDWVVRVHIPEGQGPFPVFLLLHGWTGDEDAMWIIASRLPKHALILAPRGVFTAGPRGYAWYEASTKPWPHMGDFDIANQRLSQLLNLALFPQGNFDQLHVVGFSQGAAAGYAFTLLNPERVSSLAGLAGFMPEGSSYFAKDGRLKRLPVFVTHGTQDVMVPVEYARESVSILEQAGAKVTYCEDDVGHKLSASCFRGLEKFYQSIQMA